VVVVGGGWVPGMVPPVIAVVVAATCHRVAVVVMVMVRGKVMICILTRFPALILDPGQT